MFLFKLNYSLGNGVWIVLSVLLEYRTITRTISLQAQVSPASGRHKTITTAEQWAIYRRTCFGWKRKSLMSQSIRAIILLHQGSDPVEGELARTCLRRQIEYGNTFHGLFIIVAMYRENTWNSTNCRSRSDILLVWCVYLSGFKPGICTAVGYSYELPILQMVG